MPDKMHRSDKRIDALRRLHELGCNTWASIEPYPTPNIIEQDLGSILSAVSFTNRIIFGRTNYSRRVSDYKEHKKFYNESADEVIRYCHEHKIKLHIKNRTTSN